MISKTRKQDRLVRKLVALDQNSRNRHTYFVMGNLEEGYRWSLTDLNGNNLCSSDLFATKSDCLKTLRAVQSHAATEDMRDEAQ